MDVYALRRSQNQNGLLSDAILWQAEALSKLISQTPCYTGMEFEMTLYLNTQEEHA